MNCTSARASFLWLLLAGILSACSSSGVKKSSTEMPAAEPGVIAGASLLPAGPATLNPYLQGKTAVRAELQQIFAEARRAMIGKEWSRAERLLQQIIAQDASLSGAHLNLGIVYRSQGDVAQAEQAFTRAIAANHTNLDAYNQLGILAREAGEFAVAERHYQKALSLWPYHPDSHKNIAILYDLYMGKSAEALPHYEAYLALIGGEEKQVKSWIADLQRRLGIQNPSKKPRENLAAEASSDE